MAKTHKRAKKRSLFRELMSGVGAMRDHREGRVTLRTHQVEPIALPALRPALVRQTREALHMSRQVFAFKLGVNPRTLACVHCRPAASLRSLKRREGGFHAPHSG
jgi:DNA-binding transcriptional regulator YiaG